MLLAFPSTQAHAHLVASSAGQDGYGANLWMPDPVAVMLLLLTGLWYWGGTRSRRIAGGQGVASTRRVRLFWAGWFSLAAVLVSPIDPLGELLFSVHMVQHEVMMLVAAPLLVASRPLAAVMRGLPRQLAVLTGAGLRVTGAGVWAAWLRIPAVAWLIHAVGLWAWHWPVLFDAGLNSTWVHTLQHVSFLWIALIFWNALMKPHQDALAANVLYLFTTAIHASALGALLTLSPRVWYEDYRTTAPQWGLSALEDQQLGGLIMWVPGGIVFVAAGLLSLARVLGHGDTTGNREGRPR